MSRVLASVGIFVDRAKKKDALAQLYDIENVEEIYDVSGEFDILSIVSASSLEELRETLHSRILKVAGVSSAITNVILQPHQVAGHSKSPRSTSRQR